MPSFSFSKDAEQDLRQIFRYTKQKWGLKQATKYKESLKLRLHEITTSVIKDKQLSTNLPDIFLSKAEFHHIYYLRINRSEIIVIAILSPKQDTLAHLKLRTKL